MQVLGANPESQPVGLDEMPGKVNYFIGNDPAQWHTDIPTYAKVEYPQVYDGINLVYYGNQQQLEYDFVVGAVRDPATINLGFSGAGQFDLDGQGDLVLQTPSGPLVQNKPVIYQDVNGVRQEIAGGYVLRGRSKLASRSVPMTHRSPWSSIRCSRTPRTWAAVCKIWAMPLPWTAPATST